MRQMGPLGPTGPVQNYFVDGSAGTTGSGTRSDPYESLDDALSDANADGTQSNIYIRGDDDPMNPDPDFTYIPSVGASAEERTFTLDDDDHLIGGWDGNDTGAIVVQPGSYVVTLSGDQGSSVYSYHVVTVPLASSGTQTISGCTITAGDALGTSGLEGFGGGLLNDGGTVVLDTCIFKLNHAVFAGGAVYSGYDAATYVFDCTFQDNSVKFAGGAIANGASNSGDSGYGYVEIWSTTFVGNEATSGAGGAVYCGESTDTTEAANETMIIDCLFELNLASSAGGGAVATEDALASSGAGQMPIVAIYSSQIFDNTAAGEGGGVFVGAGWKAVSPTVYYAPQVDIVNTSFCRNEAVNEGGGIFVGYGGTSDDIDGLLADVRVINCTLHENDAGITDGGGAIFTEVDQVIVANTIAWDNRANGFSNEIEPVSIPKVYYSDVEGGWSGTGSNNFNVNPDILSYDDCEVPIDTDSPIEDEGLESFLPYDVFDIDGDSNTTERLPDLFLLLRVVNGGGGLAPDIGARENQ